MADLKDVRQDLQDALRDLEGARHWALKCAQRVEQFAKELLVETCPDDRMQDRYADLQRRLLDMRSAADELWRRAADAGKEAASARKMAAQAPSAEQAEQHAAASREASAREDVCSSQAIGIQNRMDAIQGELEELAQHMIDF